MEFAMDALGAVGLVLLGLWGWSLKASLGRDRAAAAERDRAERERRAMEAREAQRQRQGVRLRCLGCGHAFRGPMPDTGCPECHLAALVVTEGEYKNGDKDIQDKATE